MSLPSSSTQSFFEFFDFFGSEETKLVRAREPEIEFNHAVINRAGENVRLREELNNLFGANVRPFEYYDSLNTHSQTFFDL